MSLFVDLRPLRGRGGFRWLWASSLMSGIGGQIGIFAVTFQVYELTGSSLAVGGIGLCVAIPTIAFAMVGGTLADAADRRRVLTVALAVQVLIALGFLAQAALQLDSLALIYALVAAQATVGALAGPARRAAMRRLLPPELIASALALTLLVMHVTQIVGPLAGGAIAAWGSVAWCFAVQAAGCGLALIGMLALPPMPVDGSVKLLSARPTVEAVRFIAQSPPIRSAFIVDLAMTVLAVPAALFPALNDALFGGSAVTLGLLSSAVAVGGVAGILFSAPLGRITRHGRALMIAAFVWAGTVVALGVVTQLWAVILVLVAGGIADVVALTLGQTIVQNSTPDAVRGRVSAAEQMVQMGGPQLGGIRAGALGSVVGPSAAIVIGGVSAALALGLYLLGSSSAGRLRRRH